METARSIVHPAPRGPRAARQFVVLAVVPLVVAVGCKKKSSPDATAEPAASAAGASSGAALAGKPASEFKDARFQLQIQPKGSYKAGQAGQVQIVLSANAPFHCNDKYPYKFKLKDSEGVKYADKIVKKDAVQLEKHRATMTVDFTPESTGKKTIAGKFLFSLCSADKCLVERRDLSLDVNVD
jgi:hypothetical protein